MIDLHERLKTQIKQSDFDYKSLSLEIGQGERYISNLLNSRSDPGFSNVVKICAALGLTPNQLAGLDDQITLTGGQIDQRIVSAQAERILTAVTREAHRKLNQRGARPLLDDVLTWWHQQRGRLSNFDTLSDHVDLYLAPEPEAKLPEPVLMGAQSLATVSFGVKSVEHMRQLFQNFDPALSESVKIAHAETARKHQPSLTIEEIEVSLPGHSFPLRFHYKRLLLPVTDSNGNDFVLNYSQPLE